MTYCRSIIAPAISKTLAIAAGVLQVEAMAQLGGIVMMDPDRDMSEQQNFFFGGIDSCKFRRPVVPGDTLVGFPAAKTIFTQCRVQKQSCKLVVGCQRGGQREVHHEICQVRDLF